MKYDINNNSRNNEESRKFYKIYSKGEKGEKIYKGRVLKSSELSQFQYLGGVSCFIIDENGNVLIEKRGNTKITSGEIDLCSGHIDNNETPTQAMIHEYIEELHNNTQNSNEKEQARNEAIDNLKKLDELDLIFKNNGNERKFFIQFYALKTKLKNVTLQKAEVESIEWLPMQEVFEMIRQGKTKFPYDERFESLFKQVEEHYQSKNKEDIQDINK